MKRSGGCNCIMEIDKQLQETLGDPRAMLEISISLSGGCYPYMSAVYRRKGKGGDFGTRDCHKTVIPTYCPFCGRKYKVKHGG